MNEVGVLLIEIFNILEHELKLLLLRMNYAKKPFKSVHSCCNIWYPDNTYAGIYNVLVCLLKFIVTYQEDFEPGMFQQEHHKTEMIQKEHHKTEMIQ